MKVYVVLFVFYGCCGISTGISKRLLLQDPDHLVDHLNRLETTIHLLNTTLTQVILDNQKQKQQYEALLQKDHGSSGGTYVRWGRTQCEGDATLVYDGVAAGKRYDLGGSGANPLCLPNDPEWKASAMGIQDWTAEIFGLEIDILNNNQPFGTSFLNKDMPCAVCKTNGRSAVLMIPGKITCNHDWHKEFSGYLVAQASRPGLTSTEYICADEHLESVPGGDGDDNEAIVWPVEIGSCITLKCPPYEKGRELTCVVCSQ